MRNALYDAGLLRSTEFAIPVICVGNLTVGGTGKTPTINYLIDHLLSKGVNVGIVSRGYGRTSKGFFIIDDASNAALVGDEPLLFFKRWGIKAVIAVGEQRVHAIRSMREMYPQLDVILMDDGFQHRAVQPSASILLTSYQNPFYRDFILPSGTLREGRRWARRASMVVVTKSPLNIQPDEKLEIEKRLGRYTRKGVPIFFSSIAYGEPVAFGENREWKQKVFLVTGIANPAPLVDYLVQKGIEILNHWVKADHFIYSELEMQLIVEEYKKLDDCVVLTTEKDFVKMGSEEFAPYLAKAPFFYIPVEFSFSKEKQNFEAAFDQLIVKHQGAKG